MRAVLTEPFAANLIASPPEVQKAFGKQLTNLLRDLRHPSLRASRLLDLGTGLPGRRIIPVLRSFAPIRLRKRTSRVTPPARRLRRPVLLRCADRLLPLRPAFPGSAALAVARRVRPGQPASRGAISLDVPRWRA